MKVSEIVAWVDLVVRRATPEDVAAAGLGTSIERRGRMEELSPADPRFRAIRLGWSADERALESIVVRIRPGEQLREDVLSNRYGPLRLEAAQLDMPDKPARRFTVFDSRDDRQHALGIQLDDDGTVSTVSVHVVRPTAAVGR